MVQDAGAVIVGTLTHLENKCSKWITESKTQYLSPASIPFTDIIIIRHDHFEDDEMEHIMRLVFGEENELEEESDEDKESNSESESENSLKDDHIL